MRRRPSGLRRSDLGRDDGERLGSSGPGRDGHAESVHPEHVVILFTLALLTMAGASALSGPIRIAAPLLLVVFGGLVGFVPGVPEFEIDPE